VPGFGHCISVELLRALFAFGFRALEEGHAVVGWFFERVDSVLIIMRGYSDILIITLPRYVSFAYVPSGKYCSSVVVDLSEREDNVVFESAKPV
jgi:hypothetical protein